MRTTLPQGTASNLHRRLLSRRSGALQEPENRDGGVWLQEQDGNRRRWNAVDVRN